MSSAMLAFVPILTTFEYAAKCGKTRQWIAKLISDGRIPSAKWKYNQWLIPENARIQPPKNKVA